MINYSPLPQRVRRVVKQYEYCIESVEVIPMNHNVFKILLKTGYEVKTTYSITGFNSMLVTPNDMEETITLLKHVTKPASRVIRTALYGFPCPICGRQTSKGSNYTDLGGMKICGLCG